MDERGRRPARRVTRRQAVIGAAAAVATASLARPQLARAAPLHLLVERRTLSVNGRAASVYGLGPAAGGRPRRFMAGERFAVTLENRLTEPTLVHWHGLTPPSAQDGTPGLSQPPLAAGAHYDYDFPLARPGTFWMHSHVGFQRAQLLAAPLIVGDRADTERDEQEVVLFLSDFSFRSPEEIYASLTSVNGTMAGTHDMHAMPGMGGGDAMDMGGKPMAGHAAAAIGGDVNDIDFDAYLANDRTLADPAVVRVEPGGQLRLRVINRAAATNFSGSIW